MIRSEFFGGSGLPPSLTASEISVLMARLSRVFAFSSQTDRTCLPCPFKIFCDSGSFTACKKQTLTQRGYTTSDKNASDGRSVGSKPQQGIVVVID
jgi:hypothetical protein